MTTQLNYPELLQHLLGGRDLDRAQAQWAFNQIMEGRLGEAQVAGLLVALSAKGESPDEIAGAAMAMRQHALRIEADGLDVIDTCGTGGTGLSTFNISTAAALVVAGAGGKVAKHGNRTATRASGSADVLIALGVNVEAAPAVVARCLQEAGVGFCFAVRCHPAMKYAVPVRKALGVRTIFNLLGPLTNPAGARRQLLGVFDAASTELVARVLGTLGSTRAMVVHADDGLDEISTVSATRVSELAGGSVTTTTVQAWDLGLARARMEDLMVDSPVASAAAIREVLSGKHGPRRDIVVLNAAAALVVAGKASGLSEGMALASASIDNNCGKGALEKLISISNS